MSWQRTDALNFSQKIDERIPQYKGRWNRSLRDQIKDLPEFDKVMREVKKHLRKMKGREKESKH